ncbi:FecR family protein [Belliella marina]|uniref:FecR family protein n=1 Tax=Belliella marina TaxID=1644146 RepID=A0ABW4VRQ0_9BACT
MKEDKFYTLLIKFFSSDLTGSERKQLDEFLLDKKNQEEFAKLALLNKKTHELLHDQNTDKEAVFERLVGKQPKNRIFDPKVLLRYAAVFLIVLMAGYGWYSKVSVHGVFDSQEVITLRMSDELVKTIDDGDNLAFQTNTGVAISQVGDTIKYSSAFEATEVVYHDLLVPHGKTAALQLSDGSEIILNSGSSLRFPENFRKGGNREVYLTGEAFFKVSEDSSRPFIVNADNVNIRVLGTHFNVNSYNGNNSIETILVEGKVGLYMNDEGYSEESTVVLLPGMRGRSNVGNGSFVVDKVNVKPYTAWLEGELIFQSETFSKITQVLERKYAVEIDLKDERLSQQKFVAKFKEESLDQILESLQASYPFNYKIIGKNKIVITK